MKNACAERSADRLACTREARAFSMLELLVVMSMIALLASLMLPSLSAARKQAKAVVCRSNVSHILAANTYYANDNRGVYVAGAAEFRQNLHRWHGTRKHLSEPFDATRGPLVPYLGPEGAIRQCPTFPATEIVQEGGGFERGNGGYGYNNAFIGVQLRQKPSGEYLVTNDRTGEPAHRIHRPAETVMFTDAAFAADQLIEYSFAEPRFHPQYPTFRMDPSVHFRHRERANVGWCDGHVDAQQRTFSWSSGFYKAAPQRLNIGWFGRSDDNSLFDLK